MKVRFLVDFQGVETNGSFFRAGDEWDFPQGDAVRLVVDGRAEAVEPEGAEEAAVTAASTDESAPDPAPEEAAG